MEGDIVEEKDVPNNVYEKCEVVLKSFIGKQKQVPPIYSAIKVNGKKLYEYARKGQEVELKTRQIEIYDIKLISYIYSSALSILFTVIVNAITHFNLKKIDMIESIKSVE